MELHVGKLHPSSRYFLASENSLEDYFYFSMLFSELNYKSTIDHYRSVRLHNLTPNKFWQEYIWAVYTSGFNSKIVSSKWSQIESHYGTWHSQPSSCPPSCLRHEQKWRAIELVRTLLNWSDLLSDVCQDPSLRTIQSLPRMGPVSSLHLARNIGHDVVKPDLHLTRLSKHYEMSSPQSMCQYLAHENKERIGVVDAMLFYAASTYGTGDIK